MPPLRRQPCEEDLPAAKRFRANLRDLFLTNQLSGIRMCHLLQDAAAAGTQGLDDLADIGATNHGARDLRRRFLRGTQWPKPYNAQVRVWYPALHREGTCSLPIMLPHEIVDAIAQRAPIAKLQETCGLDGQSLTHFVGTKANLGLLDAVPLGFWADGVPVNKGRTQTLECVTMLFPGATSELLQSLRIPLTVLNRRNIVKCATFDDIFDVVRWSLQWAVLGVHPTRRHDGHTWLPSDLGRGKLAGKPLHSHSLLVEVRGDWKMMREIFRLPAWNETRGICWLCKATPNDIANVSASARWREDRMSTWDLMIRIIERGEGMCPLFMAPGIRSECFKIDWMHAADLGVAADVIGNVFAMILPLMNGHTEREKVGTLFALIQEFYKKHPEVESRLGALTKGMIAAPQKPPKLRARAAEVRGLVGFTSEIAERFLCGNDVVLQSVRALTKHLAGCYAQLSSQAPYAAVFLATHSRKLAQLYAALQDHFRLEGKPRLWRLKPKMHLFQEVCEGLHGNPSKNWCYRDEDFGGTLAILARSRGGWNTPRAVASNTLTRFRASVHVPRLLAES